MVIFLLTIFYISDGLQWDEEKNQAIMLIPPIDEKRLVQSMLFCDSKLTESDQNRNRHGPIQIYGFCEEELGKFS